MRALRHHYTNLNLPFRAVLVSRNTALIMPSLSATKVYIDPISDFTFLSTAKSGKPWIKRNTPCCALHIKHH